MVVELKHLTGNPPQPPDRPKLIERFIICVPPFRLIQLPFDKELGPMPKDTQSEKKPEHVAGKFRITDCHDAVITARCQLEKASERIR